MQKNQQGGRGTWQKRMISPSDLPFEEKSDPPLAPPMGKVVSAFLKICSKPRNLMMDRVTVGWNLRSPRTIIFTDI